MKFGLYVHYPYCLQRCTYCDFATDLYKNEEKNTDYLQVLEMEILLYLRLLEGIKLTSIYFGGGTPSLLKPEDFRRFFSFIRHHNIELSPDCEISLEINPDTVDHSKLSDLLEIGFNRFSIGVQTFNNDLLKRVDRLHTAEQTLNNLDLLDSKGVNFSCDLLYSLPTQTLPQVQSDFKQIMAFKPTHLSPYILTLPDRHPMQKGRAPEDKQVEMLEWITYQAHQQGYQQYEISNFAKDTFTCKHNLNAWRGENYLGIGMSAHSYINHGDFGLRFHNPMTVNAYARQVSQRSSGSAYESLPSSQVEYLQAHEALSDFCHTSLRLREGLNLEKARRRFGEKIGNLLLMRAQHVKMNDFLILQNNSFRLSKKGILFSNQVFEHFLFMKEDIAHLDI